MLLCAVCVVQSRRLLLIEVPLACLTTQLVCWRWVGVVVVITLLVALVLHDLASIPVIVSLDWDADFLHWSLA